MPSIIDHFDDLLCCTPHPDIGTYNHFSLSQERIWNIAIRHERLLVLVQSFISAHVIRQSEQSLFEFYQFGLILNIFEDVMLEKHVPNVEDLEQLDHLDLPLFFIQQRVVQSFLPDKLKQKGNFLFKKSDVVSLNVFYNSVNYIN